MHPESSVASGTAMTPLELRASVSLASIFALRMLGLFLILPVFAVHATTLPGGDNTFLVGLAMGIYGLTQCFLQIPYGSASDRFGRKPVIIFGLVLFALGSFIAAASTSLLWVIIGRAIQGAGAISAAVTAFIADATREEQRTKAMAMVGASIGLTFAGSLVGAPLLYEVIGMSGLFAVTGVLSIASILVVLYIVPAAPPVARSRVPFSIVLRNAELMRLNFGVFVLHLVQMAMFVVVPTMMVEAADLAVTEHWKIYLPIVIASFVLMLPPVFVGEKRGRTKHVFLGTIALLLIVQLGLWLFADGVIQHWHWLLVLLLAFFTAFNVLEASQPSLVSRIAPPDAKGAALGVYNTLQAFGLFCGATLGGWLSQYTGPVSVFILGAGASLAWLIIASNMKNLPRRRAVPAVVIN